MSRRVKKRNINKILSFVLVTCMILSGMVMPFEESYTSSVVASAEEIPVLENSTTVFDFEKLIDELDKDPLEGFEGLSGTTISTTVELDGKNTTEGGTSALKITPYESTFNVQYKLDSLIIGGEISFEFYDDMSTKKDMLLLLTGAEDNTSYAYEMAIGIRESNTSYAVHSKSATTYSSAASLITVNTIKRTTGWHTMTVDMTEMGQVTFYVDGKVLAVLELEETEFAEFSSFQFVDFWGSGIADDKNIYIDDITISVPSPVPTDLTVNDEEDTFDWEYDSTRISPTDYEYSLDGGLTFTTCTDKPVYVGNEDYAVGDVQVRVIAPVSGGYTYPVVQNTEVFTFTYNESIYMEREEDIDTLNSTVNVPATGTLDPNTITPELTLTTEVSHSGLTSLKLVPDTTSDSENRISSSLYRVGKTYDELMTEKVITIWMYDELEDSNPDYKMMINVREGTDLTPDASILSECYVGFTNAFDSDNYLVRSKTDVVDENWSSWGDTGIERTVGWHCFQFDYAENPGYVNVYIDGTLVRTYDTEGFNQFYVQDTWAHTKSYTAEYYVDDIFITDSRDEVPVIQDAPTNSVVDTVNYTYAWDYVEGKTDYSLYEYSIDNGATFQACTGNPQTVPEKLMEIGTVMVRLAATDTELAGSVLRSTERYTDSNTILVDKIQEIITFSETANPSDYTTSSWEAYEAKMVEAEAAIEAEINLQEPYEALIAAEEALVFDLENETYYPFNDGVFPVEPLYGTIDLENNDSFITDTAYVINTETVNGSQIAELKYTFPKALEDKEITFFYWDADDLGGEMSISIGNSETGYGNEIASTYLSGSSSTGYVFYDLVDGERTNQKTLSMNRQDELLTIEVNLTGDKGIQIYMNTILVFSNPYVDSIDYLDFTVTKSGTSSTTYLSVDDLMIREANPVLEISYPSDVVEIGYYDTYEMNVVNYELTTLYDYDTTDIFTYSIADPTVAYMTDGGSIQPVAMEGTTEATITSNTGATKTITVNVNDYKVEGIQLSDAIITQEVNYITELTMEPEEIKVINAILEPSNVTIRDVVWTSSDESVATVIDGQISTWKEGSAVITATTVDGGHEATINLTVEKEVIDYAVEIFVSADGDDINGDGTIENPFNTPSRARDEARTYCSIIEGGVIIYFLEGEYVFNETFSLEDQDSGSENSPVMYCAYTGENVTFSGSFTLAPSDFEVVTDEEMLWKIQDYAEGYVYVADVSAQIGEEPLSVIAGGAGYTQSDVAAQLVEGGVNISDPYYSVSMGDETMTLSRWPNEEDQLSGCEYPGFSQINSITYKGSTIRNWWPDMVNDVRYEAEEDRDVFDGYKFKSTTLTARMASWNGIAMDGSSILDEDIWYNGYSGVSYSPQTSPIESIAADGTVESYIAATYWPYVASFSRAYVYNLIQELDIEGEWYLDTDEGKLYVYPYSTIDMNSDEQMISVSTLVDTMITMENTKYITLQNIDMSDMVGTTLTISGGNNNTISRCDITNVVSSVGSITDSNTEVSMYNGFEYCYIKDVDGGLIISGASSNSDTLEAGFNYVNGCIFDSFQADADSPVGVSLQGIGNIVTSCEFKNAPNLAIKFSGNDNVIEFNNIHDVDLQATDASAIYTGRNALVRGTVIKNNYIHHIGKYGDVTSSNIGIYIDDMACDVDIYDNVIEDITWAVFINGGQANYIYDNAFIDCTYGVIATDWSYCWASRWYQHGYGLINDPLSIEPTTIDWSDPDGVYAKYDYMLTTYEDNFNNSIYNKVINNDYTGTDNLFEYRVRGYQPNTISVLQDWYFDKDNYQES